MLLIRDLIIRYHSLNITKECGYPVLKMHPGKLNLLVGDNASGKSSLGKYLFDYSGIMCKKGRVTYFGKIVNCSMREYGFYYIPQERPKLGPIKCSQLLQLYQNSKKNFEYHENELSQLIGDTFCSDISNGEWKKLLVGIINEQKNINGIYFDEVLSGLSNPSKIWVIKKIMKSVIRKNICAIITMVKNDKDIMLVNDLVADKSLINTINI